MIINKVKIIIKNIIWTIHQKKASENEYSSKKSELSNHSQGKTIYLIGRPEKVGLFSYVETTLRYVAYALEKGYVPFVQIKGYPNTYVEDECVEHQDMWSLYFEQPYEVLTGNKVVINECDNILTCIEEDMSKVPYRDGVSRLKQASWFWSGIYKDFFGLNKSSYEYCEQEFKEIFDGNGTNVLGVLVRGTDIVNAHGHHVQPSVEKIIKKARKLIQTGKYSKIYIASEEEKNVNLFRDEFGENRILVNKRVYYDSVVFGNGLTINDVVSERENGKYLNGLEYLSSVMLLSRCGGLIGGICGGSIAAYYINGGKYKDVHLLDEGVVR